VDSADPVASGQDVIYTLSVTNNSDRAANEVRVTDGLDALASFVSAQNRRGASRLVGRSVLFELGTLASRQSVAVSVTLRLHSAAASTSRNVARVASRQPDLQPLDNVAEQDTAITPAPAPNLVLAQGPLLSTGAYLPGLFGNGTVPIFGQRITITNAGSAAYSGPLAIAFDNLPRSVQLQDAGGTTTTPPAGSPFVVVNLGGNTLAPGQAVTVALRFASPTRNFSFTPRLITSATR